MKAKFISGYITDTKQNPAWIIWLLFILIINCCLVLSETDFDKFNKVVFKVNTTDIQTLFTNLKTYNFSLLHEVTPSTYIFINNRFHGNKKVQEVLQKVLDAFPNEIIAAEPVRLYVNALQPWDPGKSNSKEEFENIPSPNVERVNVGGMGVSGAWSRGYSGKGVTIAVTGVGIDTQLLDLQKNMNLSLSYNYVTNTVDVTPESFVNSRRKALQYTDHGNRVAGILAAEKGNKICSAGIAYNSSLVGIKMFAVKMLDQSSLSLIPAHVTSSDSVSRALVHRLDDIDIYVNGWTTSALFDSVDLATREAIAYGATKGRHGLGAVYVFPAGPAGNQLSNSVYTITVGMFGVKGTRRSDSVLDASVLTSGLGDGDSLTSTTMITTSHDNKCISSFNGYSAAVSQIGGIIGLGLQANKKLTLREIQHLLVKSSDYVGLNVTSTFKRNGAGYYYNEMFGFGLLNAEKFVTLAEEMVPVSPIITETIRSSNIRAIDAITTSIEFCYSCEVSRDPNCMTSVEHVSVSLEIDTIPNNIKMELISPSDTSSVIMDLAESSQERIATKEIKLVSTNFWDEVPLGKWILTVKGQQTDSEIHIRTSVLTLYGTRNETLAKSDHVTENMKCLTEQTSQNIEIAVTKTTPVESATAAAAGDDNSKLSIPLIVILPLGIVIMCGMLVFIFKRGGTPGPVSSFEKPVKIKKQSSFRRRNMDDPLHRQVSLLRQQSKQESYAEDSEGEEAEEQNGQV